MLLNSKEGLNRVVIACFIVECSCSSFKFVGGFGPVWHLDAKFVLLLKGSVNFLLRCVVKWGPTCKFAFEGVSFYAGDWPTREAKKSDGFFKPIGSHNCQRAALHHFFKICSWNAKLYIWIAQIAICLDSSSYFLKVAMSWKLKNIRSSVAFNPDPNFSQQRKFKLGQIY